MGCWSYFEGMLEELAEALGFAHPRPRYAGRHSSASPAVGMLERHKIEQAKLVDEALTVGLPRVGRLGAGRKRDGGDDGRRGAEGGAA